jgi:hypothetical protein
MVKYMSGFDPSEAGHVREKKNWDDFFLTKICG